MAYQYDILLEKFGSLFSRNDITPSIASLEIPLDAIT